MNRERALSLLTFALARPSARRPIVAAPGERRLADRPWQGPDWPGTKTQWPSVVAGAALLPGAAFSGRQTGRIFVPRCPKFQHVLDRDSRGRLPCERWDCGVLGRAARAGRNMRVPSSTSGGAAARGVAYLSHDRCHLMLASGVVQSAVRPLATATSFPGRGVGVYRPSDRACVWTRARQGVQ